MQEDSLPSELSGEQGNEKANPPTANNICARALPLLTWIFIAWRLPIFS